MCLGQEDLLLNVFFKQKPRLSSSISKILYSSLFRAGSNGIHSLNYFSSSINIVQTELKLGLSPCTNFK